jgi:TPR repeat protein
MEKIRIKAEKGNADSQYELGCLYEKGDGVQMNLNIAKEWYSKAAAQGHNIAESKLMLLNRKNIYNK